MDQRGCLLYTEFCRQISVLIGKELFVSKAGLVQQRASDLTVGAGCGGEQPCAVVCVGGRSGFTADLFGVQGTFVGQLGAFDVVNLTILVFLRLTVVPVLDRTVVTGDTAVNLGLFAALGAYKLLAYQVTVVLTYGVGGGQGVVRQLVVFCDLLGDKMAMIVDDGKILYHSVKLLRGLILEHEIIVDKTHNVTPSLNIEISRKP